MRRVLKKQNSSFQNRAAARQDRTGADGRQIAEDALFLDKIYVKHLRSIPEMLSNLEKAKPDKVQIDEVVFSKDMRAVTLIGSSYSPGAISQFLDQLSLADGMAIDLSREEIGENKLIRFELTARWINGSDASKI